MTDRYEEILGRFMKEHFNCLEDFEALMTARAEKASREIVGANYDSIVHAVRGQISVCYEMADEARAALESGKAKAKAGTDDGYPSSFPWSGEAPPTESLG